MPFDFRLTKRLGPLRLHLSGVSAGLRLDVGPADVREAGQPRPAQRQAADRLVAPALPAVDLAGGVADAIVGVDPLAGGRDRRVAECHGGCGTPLLLAQAAGWP